MVVRLLLASWTRDPAERDRFVAEASAAAQVPPYCAARIVDAGVVDDYAFLVSQYVAGPSLLEIVSDDGLFSGPQLEALAIGSATGLGSVHQAGLVHGNFGPEYVVMSASGPRVIEYGITPPYGAATPSADMLAWGRTIVYAAIGRPPATYADLDALPGHLREAVAEALSGDPALRPSARSIVLDLLGGTLPVDQALPEGARRVAGPAAGGYPAAGHPGARTGRNSGGHAGPEQAAPRGPSRPAARRPAGVWAIAAGVVVIAVVAFVLVQVLGSGGPGGQPQAGSSASTSPVSSTVSARPSVSPSSAVTVPAGFSGSWTGQARQVNPPDEFQVKLTLPSGVADGSVAYSNASFSCVGQLSPDVARSGTLTLDQGITTGRHTCADGTVTLTAAPGGALRFTFRGKTGPVATGTLTKD